MFKNEITLRLNTTEGPMKTAKITVPIPRVPPSDQPRKITDNSMLNLTKLMGFVYFFDNPVISPSLVPAPKLAIK